MEIGNVSVLKSLYQQNKTTLKTRKFKSASYRMIHYLEILFTICQKWKVNLMEMNCTWYDKTGNEMLVEKNQQP